MKHGNAHIIDRLFILLVFLGLTAFGMRALQRLLTEEPKAFTVFKLNALKETGQQFTERLNRYLGQDTSLLYPLTQWERATRRQSLKQQIVYGQDDWFFLGADGLKLDPLQMAMGVPQLSEREKLEFFLQYRQRAYWCEQNGIDYWFIVSPNKASIYPEYLPSAVPRMSSTFLDSLLPLLSEAVNQQLIDLRPDLLQAKKQNQVYYYSDTHWNQLGGLIGAKGVIRALQQAGYPVSLLPDSSFKVSPYPIPGSDLVRMAMLPQRKFEDFDYHIQLQTESMFQELPIPDVYQGHKAYLAKNPAAPLPKVLLFHDSFGHHLRPQLAPYTQSLTALWLWGEFDSRIAMAEKAPVIMDQIIERNLANYYPGNDAEVVQTYWRDHFDQLPLMAQKNLNGGEAALKALLKTAGRKSNALLVVKLELETQQDHPLEIDFGLRERFSYPLTPGSHLVYLQVNPDRPWQFRQEESFVIRSAEVRVLAD